MYEKRWYQQEAKFSIFEYFEKGGKGNPVIAMPTGTGKSHVIAEFIKDIFALWPTQRVMMLTHVKKLIQQNASKLIEVWPVAPLGIYSAGLNSRDMILPIVFGGIQSVAPAIKRAQAEQTNTPQHMRHFGWRDLLIIDEAHLLSPVETTQYQFVIAELLKINPKLKVIGLTATPYRMKQGYITDGGIFTDICYDITGIESFNRLIAEGYLAPLIARPTGTFLDTSNLSVRGGEFIENEVDSIITDEVIFSAVQEMIYFGQDRQSWLAFGSSIEKAEQINAVLQSFGVASTVVHSKLKKEADKRITAFQNGEYQCLVNKDMLTTGFDHPPIDLIADLQPTMSPGKHVQKWGRGTRPFAGNFLFRAKENCLGLDFAKNVPALGPINDPCIPRKPGKGGGEAPVKICESCGNYNHASARTCEYCGFAFSFQTKIFASAGTVAIVKSTEAQIDYFDVSHVLYSLHEKRNAQGDLITPPSIKVTYICGLQPFSEWVSLENPKASHFAKEWWRQRHTEEPPLTTHEALRKTNELRIPKRIRVHVNKKYPEVLGCEY
jgi:DNA repair protein RadD